MDDDDFNRLTFQSVLQTLNLDSQLAANGKEALDLVKAQSNLCCMFKIIFMDINMPVMGGLESSTLIK